MARITIAQVAARQTVVEARLDQQDAKLDMILAALTAGTPAKTAPKAPKAKVIAKPKARRVAKPQPKAVRFLCKATRRDFVAAAAKAGTDFSGLGTSTIAAMCLEDERLIPAGFGIGEGYRRLIAG